MEEKIKHLEFIQGIINRMSQNSFLIKGWTITLISAVFALAAKDANKSYIGVAYFPCAIFFFLDSYFLYQERIFRKLYDKVRRMNTFDFSLTPPRDYYNIFDWCKCLLSPTILFFYSAIIITIIFVRYFVN